MSSALPRIGTMPAATDLASPLVTDSRSLDDLKRDAHNDPRAAVKKAATQFEALFMQMVLKSMRDASPKSDLMGGGSSEEMYTSMFDQQLATKMAASGTGLAEVLTRQLTRHLPPQAPEAGAAAALPAQTRLDARVMRYEQTARLNAVELKVDRAPQAVRDPGARSFVQQHWDSATRAQHATGVPAGFIVSQAALESGWGKGEIRHPDGAPSHNLFGIKAGSSWSGRTVDVMTTEYENGVAKKITEKFRAYASYDEAFNDWAQLMSRNPRYAAVLHSGGDVNGFAQALQRAGYATDPRYGEKLRAVMNTVLAATPPYGGGVNVPIA